MNFLSTKGSRGLIKNLESLDLKTVRITSELPSVTAPAVFELFLMNGDSRIGVTGRVY